MKMPPNIIKIAVQDLSSDSVMLEGRGSKATYFNKFPK